MARSIKILLGLMEKLDKEIDHSIEIFFDERPFLDDPTLKPVIAEDLERQKQSKENINLLCSEIIKLCKPKPIVAVQKQIFDQ